jgi:hypothetical protein
MPFRPAQRSEFSRALLQASTARAPRVSGGAFFAYLFFAKKKIRSAAGTNTRPGHDDSAVVWVTSRKASLRSSSCC